MYLVLIDGVINIVEEGIDLVFRFGNLFDSNLISCLLCNNCCVFCVLFSYIELFGLLRYFEDLKNYCCFVFEWFG